MLHENSTSVPPAVFRTLQQAKLLSYLQNTISALECQSVFVMLCTVLGSNRTSSKYIFQLQISCQVKEERIKKTYTSIARSILTSLSGGWLNSRSKTSFYARGSNPCYRLPGSWMDPTPVMNPVAKRKVPGPEES